MVDLEGLRGTGSRDYPPLGSTRHHKGFQLKPRLQSPQGLRDKAAGPPTVSIILEWKKHGPTRNLHGAGCCGSGLIQLQRSFVMVTGSSRRVWAGVFEPWRTQDEGDRVLCGVTGNLIQRRELLTFDLKSVTLNVQSRQQQRV